MTRPYRDLVDCPRCGSRITNETAFERWFRNHPQLDSASGIVRFDLDVLVHRYMTIGPDGRGSRDVQALQFLEVKTHGHEPDLSQRDSLSIVSQVLRNRRSNMHARRHGLHVVDVTAPARAWSHVLGDHIRLRCFGGHLLQLEHDTPDSSKWIRWDHKAIDIDQLIAVIRFDLDPDTLRPIDWRRRSQPWRNARLWTDI